MKREYPGREFKPSNTIEYFDSMADAYEVVKTRKPRGAQFQKDWSMVGSEAERANLVANGWKEGADKIAPLFDAAKMATMQTKGTKHVYDVAGYMPSVPRYVAGNPMHMKKKIKAKISKAPIKIVVSIGASGGITPEYLVKRGTGIACLIMYLSVFRSVDLWVCNPVADSPRHSGGNRGYYSPMIRIGTTPFDLAGLAFALCHPGALRTITHCLLNQPDSSIPAAVIDGKDIYGMRGAEIEELIKPVLGMKDDDQYFATVNMPDLKLFADPEQWARDYLKANMGLEV